MKDYEGFLVENYQKEERTVNGIWANVVGLIISLISIGIFGFIYYKVWGNFFTRPICIIDLILYVLVLTGFLLVHELLHGIIWSKYTDVKIGVILKLIFRCCYCEKVLRIKNYIFGLIMPTIILGIIPTLGGLLLGNIVIFTFGLIFIVGGADDILVIYLLRKADRNNFIKDDDSKIGFIVYSPNKETDNG
jgi:hypothetical protein